MRLFFRMKYSVDAILSTITPLNTIRTAVLRSVYYCTYYCALNFSLESPIAYLATGIAFASSIDLGVERIATKSTSKEKEGSST